MPRENFLNGYLNIIFIYKKHLLLQLLLET